MCMCVCVCLYHTYRPLNCDIYNTHTCTNTYTFMYMTVLYYGVKVYLHSKNMPTRKFIKIISQWLLVRVGHHLHYSS